MSDIQHMAIQTRIEANARLIASIQEENDRLMTCLVRTPAVFLDVKDRWETLERHIQSRLDHVLKVDRLVPDLSRCRFILELKSRHSEVCVYEWYVWLPKSETKIPHYDKIALTETHPYLSPVNIDWELVAHMVSIQRLQFILPLS